MKIVVCILVCLVARCLANVVSCGGHTHDDDYSRESGSVYPENIRYEQRAPFVHSEEETSSLEFQKGRLPYGHDSGSEARILNKNTKIEAIDQNDDAGGQGDVYSDGYDNGLVRNALEFEKVNIVQPIVQFSGQGGGHTDYGNLPVGLEAELLPQQPEVQSLELSVSGHGIRQSPVYGGYENVPVPDSRKILDGFHQQATVQALKQHASGHYSGQIKDNGNGPVRGGLEAEILSVLHDQRKVASIEQHVGGGHTSVYSAYDSGHANDILLSVLHQQSKVQAAEQQVGGHNKGHGTDGVEADILSVLRQQTNTNTLNVGGAHGPLREGLVPEILRVLNQTPSNRQVDGAHGVVHISGHGTDDALEAEILKVIQQQPYVQTIKVIHQQSAGNPSNVPPKLPEDSEVENIRVHEKVINANGYSNDGGVVQTVQVIHRNGAGQGGNYDSPVLGNQNGYSGGVYGAGAKQVGNYGIYAGADQGGYSGGSYDSPVVGNQNGYSGHSYDSNAEQVGHDSGGNYDSPVLDNQVNYSGQSYGSNAGAEQVDNYGPGHYSSGRYAANAAVSFDKKIQTFNSLKEPSTGIQFP